MSHKGKCVIDILSIHCVGSIVVVVVASVADSKANKCALLLILVQQLTTILFDDRYGICVLISCRCSPNIDKNLFCTCAMKNKHKCVVDVGAA